MNQDPKHPAPDPLDQAIVALRDAHLPPGPPPQLATVTVHLIARELHTIPFKERILAMLWKTRYASVVAAMLFVGAATWFLFSANNAFAFDEVQAKLRTVRSATFSIDAANDDSRPPGRGYFLSPGKLRFEDAEGAVTIIDFEQEKMILLLPDKHAILVNIKNMPPDRKVGIANPFDMLANASPSRTKLLRRETVDGRATNVYSLGSTLLLDTTQTVWVDVETRLPAKTELALEKANIPGRWFITDFAWNKELDENLFNTDVPPGYWQHTESFDFSEPTEIELVEALRTFTSFNDGRFPDTIDSAELDKNVPAEGDTPEGIQRYYDLMEKIDRGVLFATTVQKSDRDWHYAGAGVKLGDADKIAWWKTTKDAPTYRVLYGDLTIKDVKAEDLPGAKSR